MKSKYGVQTTLSRLSSEGTRDPESDYLVGGKGNDV